MKHYVRILKAQVCDAKKKDGKRCRNKAVVFTTKGKYCKLHC